MTYGKPDNNRALKKAWNYDLKSGQSRYQGSLKNVFLFFVVCFFLLFLIYFLF